jgi:hypothetical protein
MCLGSEHTHTVGPGKNLHTHRYGLLPVRAIAVGNDSGYSVQLHVCVHTFILVHTGMPRIAL